MFLMALTGQMGFVPKRGIFKILTAFLACIVLDHFINRKSPGVQKQCLPLLSGRKGKMYFWYGGLGLKALEMKKG